VFAGDRKGRPYEKQEENARQGAKIFVPYYDIIV